LKNSGKSIIGATNIINYVQSKNIDIDSRLNRSQKAESIAFRSLCEDKLLPALVDQVFFQNINRNIDLFLVAC
jgi:predicted secreted acid phosphatase